MKINHLLLASVLAAGASAPAFATTTNRAHVPATRLHALRHDLSRSGMAHRVAANDAQARPTVQTPAPMAGQAAPSGTATTVPGTAAPSADLRRPGDRPVVAGTPKPADARPAVGASAAGSTTGSAANNTTGSTTGNMTRSTMGSTAGSSVGGAAGSTAGVPATTPTAPIRTN